MTLNILSAENMAAPRSTVPTCTEGRQTVVSGELAPATPMQTAIPGTGEEAILIGPDKTRGPVFEIFDITKWVTASVRKAGTKSVDSSKIEDMLLPSTC